MYLPLPNDQQMEYRSAIIVMQRTAMKRSHSMIGLLDIDMKFPAVYILYEKISWLLHTYKVAFSLWNPGVNLNWQPGTRACNQKRS